MKLNKFRANLWKQRFKKVQEVYMYPLKFKKCFIKKVWGGRSFNEFLEMSLPSEDKYGESWEVSSHKNGMSYVSDGFYEGFSLEELIRRDPVNLLGKDIVENYKGKFPILIKYLDIHDRLSVQVHPDDEYALRVEGEFGKSETWYIIEASSDAKVIMGVKEGVTREEFLKKTKNSDFDDLFNIVSIKKGDFIDVRPGLVHASLEGSVLLCEIQQSSDITYRIYDFDRLVEGEPRPLHLDKAADVINFDEKPIISTAESRKKISVEGAVKEELIRGKYFNVDRYLIDGVFIDDININFKVYSVINGSGDIIYDGKSYTLNKGDTYFIPAGLKINIKGNLEVLKSYL